MTNEDAFTSLESGVVTVDQHLETDLAAVDCSVVPQVKAQDNKVSKLATAQHKSPDIRFMNCFSVDKPGYKR